MQVVRTVPISGFGGHEDRRHDVRPEGCERVADAAQYLALDWLESQARVARLWIDRLVAEGDPGGLVATLETQRRWLEVQLDRLGRQGADRS